MELKAETLNHIHVPEERGELFHSYDSATTEDEYLHLIYSLTYCLKPHRVLETGTWQGIGSAFICRALRRNGMGHLTSIEIEPRCAEVSREQLRINQLTAYGDVLTADSVSWLQHTEMTFDFAFFDSLIPLRTVELGICIERGILAPGAMCALHDTSRLRTLNDGSLDDTSRKYWEALESMERIKFLEFPYSRGLTLVQVTE